MANTLTIDQISSVLRKVLSQATGRTDLAQLDTSALLTIGQKYQSETQGMGVDPVLGVISQMVSKTIFSARPYKRKFATLQSDSMTWGNMVRKLKILDKETDVDNNKYIPLSEGTSVDQYEIDNTSVYQLNFYGQQTYEISKTIYDTQYNVCFNSAEEFVRFLGMIMTYVANKIESIHENTARSVVSSMIAGRIAEKKAVPTQDTVVYLIDEYNAATGAQLDGTTVYAVENFKPFMEWAYAYINTVSERMTEYSSIYQTNVTEGYINQHTPKDHQVAYFFTPLIEQVKSRVLVNEFNANLMKLPGFEKVNFWQSIKKPNEINIKHANYLGANGQITDGGAISVKNVFGILADRDAMGYNPILIRTKQTPYNAQGEYRNMFWKFNERYWTDFTEKSVVFVLDKAPEAA